MDVDTVVSVVTLTHYINASSLMNAAAIACLPISMTH